VGEVVVVMRFLAPVGGKTTAYGIITAPNHKGVPADIVRGKIWAGDVGCLQGPAYVKKINLSVTLEWLKVMDIYRSRCLFVAGADIVGDALATLETYEEFRRYFDPWPVAYVAQNGAELLPIPDDCAAVFIGGDTAWKCSMAAVEVIKRAQAMGKHVHIGRVNWGKRYRLFRVLEGSELFTCDGTRTRYDGTAGTLKAWHGYEAQSPLIVI
jgi:hypothetical protein